MWKYLVVRFRPMLQILKWHRVKSETAVCRLFTGRVRSSLRSIARACLTGIDFVYSHFTYRLSCWCRGLSFTATLASFSLRCNCCLFTNHLANVDNLELYVLRCRLYISVSGALRFLVLNMVGLYRMVADGFRCIWGMTMLRWRPCNTHLMAH